MHFGVRVRDGIRHVHVFMHCVSCDINSNLLLDVRTLTVYVLPLKGQVQCPPFSFAVLCRYKSASDVSHAKGHATHPLAKVVQGSTSPHPVGCELFLRETTSPYSTPSASTSER